MKHFQIKDLEKISGIKAHTIRIWESRYGFIIPERDAINCRVYTLDQVVHILNVVLLMQNGYKISKLSNMSQPELQACLDRLQDLPGKQQKIFISLFQAMHQLEAGRFNKILDDFISQENNDALVTGVLYPFLQKTGLLWHGHRLIEEHFVVTAIRQKLMLGIEQSGTNHSSRKVLMFLPNENQLDLALLYTSYKLGKNGISTIYLGNDVSIENLLPVLSMHQPEFVYTYLPASHRFNIGKLSKMIAAESPKTMLLISFHPYEKLLVNFQNVLYLGIDDALDYINVYNAVNDFPRADLAIN